jgi:hypothetical protein
LGDPTLAQIIIIIIIIINLLSTYGNFGKKFPGTFGTSFSEKYFVRVALDFFLYPSDEFAKKKGGALA